MVLESAAENVNARLLNVKRIVFSWSASTYARALWKSADAIKQTLI